MVSKLVSLTRSVPGLRPDGGFASLVTDGHDVLLITGSARPLAPSGNLCAFARRNLSSHASS